MSTALSQLGKLVIVATVLLSLVTAPTMAYAGGNKNDEPAQKASAFAKLGKAAKAKIARAKMAGMSVAGNAGWAAALAGGTIYTAMHPAADVPFVTDFVGHPGTTMVLGGFAIYNGIQAFRKWRAEKAMNE
jgi:hypothetical protein